MLDGREDTRHKRHNPRKLRKDMYVSLRVYVWNREQYNQLLKKYTKYIQMRAGRL